MDEFNQDPFALLLDGDFVGFVKLAELSHKYNPNRDELGRFASGGSGGSIPTSEEMKSAVSDYLGTEPDIKSMEVLPVEDFDSRFGSENDAIHGGVAAIRTNDGDIFVKEGFESDGLHETVHAAGMLENGVGETINEGVTQSTTKAIADGKGWNVRDTYSDEVAFVDKYVIPATGMNHQDFAKGYAKAENKGEFIVEAIWSKHGGKFSDADDWGKDPKTNMMKTIPNALGPTSHLDYLVNEVGI